MSEYETHPHAKKLVIIIDDNKSRVIHPTNKFEGDWEGLARALESKFKSFKVV